jgi:phage terminase small subunit
MSTTALSLRQSRFVEEYVINGNASEAARRAGYSANCASEIGYENLRKPQVVARIQALQQANATVMELNRQDVISAILGAIRTAREQGAPAVMIRGLVEVARLCGFYEPGSLEAERRRQQPDGTDDVRHLPTSELMRRISAEGDLRNPDGSAMLPQQIDAFYKGLTTDELTALAEGHARIEMRVVMFEGSD